MEYENSKINDRNRIISHIAGITLLVVTLATYRWANPEIDSDDAYPKPACFDSLDSVDQQYFLDNRDFILNYHDAYSPLTEELLLHVDCPNENREVIVSPDSSVLSVEAP